MLTQAIVQSSTPMVLDIESVDPDEILICTSISGLSRAGATLFTGEFARAGGYYQGRRPKARNPVMNFKLNPDYVNDIEVSDVREMLYRQFMDPHADSDAVQVTLIDDRKPDRYFIGYTEDIEADMFEKEIKASVSMFCTDPFLRSAAETTESNVGGWFTYPIAYEGSADTGLEMDFKILGSTNQLTIVNNAEEMILDGAFVAGDVVSINTSEGSRKVQLNDEDVMVRLRSGSDWIQLKQASNTLTMYGSALGDGKVAMTSQKYRAAWWGV
jgi:hypothetical protein